MCIRDSKKGDKYTSVMTVNIVIVALLSFSTDPFKGGAFYLLSNLHNLAASTGSAAVELNTAAYFAFARLISVCVIILLLLMMKFAYRIESPRSGSWTQPPSIKNLCRP